MWIACIIILLTLHRFTDGSTEDDLDNMIIENRIEFDFQYVNGKSLDVFKVPNRERYYVKPLCELVSKSVVCIENEYNINHPYIVILPIRLWSDHAAETAALEAERRNKSFANPANFGVLPFKDARLITNIKSSDFSIPAEFSPNVRNDGQDVKFQVYPKNKEICEKMAKDAMEGPESFLHKINLYFEYTMKAVKEEGREVNVTSQNLIDSEIFSMLNNTYENKNGVVYLTSPDMNTFSKSILSSMKIIDVRTINHVTTDEEDRLISNLIRGLQEEQVTASNLSHNEWDSVFWNDLFSRPDQETSYLEKTFTYDQGKDRFIYNSDKAEEFFGQLQDKLDEYKDKSWAAKVSAHYGLIGGTATVNRTDIEDFKKDWQNITSTAQRDALSKDVLNEFLKKSGKNVEWTGEKFTPKGLSLHRVNTNKLLVKGEIYYGKMIKIDVNVTIRNKIVPESVEDVNDVPSVSFYEDLKNQKARLFDLEKKFSEKINSIEEAADKFSDFLSQQEIVQGNISSIESKLQTNIDNQRTQLQGNIDTQITQLNSKITSLESSISSARSNSEASINSLRNEINSKLANFADKPKHALVYEHNDHRGSYFELSIFGDKCMDDLWHSELNDEGSSINVMGNCVILFEHANCVGRFVRFDASCSNGCCNDFKHCGFGDVASSYRGC